MTPAEFKKKWARYSGKEISAYQEHFNDLCALLGQPSPVTADPTGSESFCFQKRVVKDAEFFAFAEEGRIAEEPETERGFADVWKRDCFAWEYKGKKKNLDEAYRQLLRYRESLLNPPLLVVCDLIATSSEQTSTGPSRKRTSSPTRTSTPRAFSRFSALSSPGPTFSSPNVERTKSLSSSRNRLAKWRAPCRNGRALS
jgi:hypothetical protein